MSSTEKPSTRLPLKTNRRTLNPWISKTLMIRPVDEQGNVTVTLSSNTTITLPRDPGRALAYFLATGSKWVSWLELYEVRVSDPDAAVLYLEELGASFERMRKDMATSNSELHLDAPHYKYLGLRIHHTSFDVNTSTKGLHA